jgi:collagen triple helix repeat protein
MNLKKAITVIAALVAVLSVTSGAFAAKQYMITSSKQVKKGSISLSDLSRHARKALHGHVGHVGPRGLKGDTGATGAQGRKGDKGDTGATGATGPHGPVGPQGPQGDSGLTGVLAPFGTSLNDGMSGWRMTGPYDAHVVENNFLQISDATASGSFGDWVFSPKVADAQTTFQAAFDIKAFPGTRSAAGDAGQWNHISVSPDDGNGNRMSYLRFENQPDGIHVIFEDVTDPGPVGTAADFNQTDIATLDPNVEHVVQFDLNLAADQVKIYIDGKLAATGTTWKNYYRYDPEQAPANTVPVTNSLIFQARGTGDAADVGKGFLINGVRLASS